MQALFKAKLERQRLREQFAGRMIKRNMRAYSRRKWLAVTVALYRGAKRENQWGRGMRARWPAPHPVWLDVKAHQRMEETWRYS